MRANQSLSSDGAEWEYIRIDFAGQMVGNSRDHFTTFRDRVRIVSGPVNRPNDVVDGDALPRHGGKMQCNVLEVTQTPPAGAQPGFIQLRGSGNAFPDELFEALRLARFSHQMEDRGVKTHATNSHEGFSRRRARLSGVPRM